MTGKLRMTVEILHDVYAALCSFSITLTLKTCYCKLPIKTRPFFFGSLFWSPPDATLCPVPAFGSVELRQDEEI